MTVITARMQGVCPVEMAQFLPVIGPEWCLKRRGGVFRRAFDNSTASPRSDREEGLRQVLPCGCSHYGLLHVTKGYAQVTMCLPSHHVDRKHQFVTYLTNKAADCGNFCIRRLGRNRRHLGGAQVNSLKPQHPPVSKLMDGCESSYSGPRPDAGRFRSGSRRAGTSRQLRTGGHRRRPVRAQCRRSHPGVRRSTPAQW